MQIKDILALSLLAAPVLSALTGESGENGFVGIKRNNKRRIDTREYEESTDVLNILEARSGTITCTPKTNKSTVKSFKIATATAEAQAKTGGFGTTTKSGYPHQYQNFNALNWGVQECDDQPKNSDSKLLEYPVYWTGASRKAWSKDEKKKAMGTNWETPMRVVYMEGSNEELIYCGVMIHETVESSLAGTDGFVVCS
ncbi:hypothetical protein ASPACDRAFT_39236 [Aspergillus aculeatus ATCC 16872]|uniref:Uncharacterized protein n=1 Tax=Aspergillus aculeatus (strain ATCC 16872 / CBS 172.66 / WB 5094) TaxID=690307 RepID=A0A1L9X5L1_ASPA1|nr:uncharacterized protein ASPACDRAFT_39236 [Aspergillus aculeatus ATCC 16872]OJK03619.1 hypothetical protein ASPACDRAFT_39236 [Aspergillus aculeatus ATCC 16872]